jgi:hypothetical protein
MGKKSLTNDEVIQLKMYLRDGKSSKWIRDQFNISRQVLCHIKKGRCYKDVTIKDEK